MTEKGVAVRKDVEAVGVDGPGPLQVELFRPVNSWRAHLVFHKERQALNSLPLENTLIPCSGNQNLRSFNILGFVNLFFLLLAVGSLVATVIVSLWFILAIALAVTASSAVHKIAPETGVGTHTHHASPKEIVSEKLECGELKNTVVIPLYSEEANLVLDDSIKEILLGIFVENPADHGGVFKDWVMSSILFEKLPALFEVAKKADALPETVATVKTIVVREYDPDYLTDEVAVIEDQLEEILKVLRDKAEAKAETDRLMELEVRRNSGKPTSRDEAEAMITAATKQLVKNFVDNTKLDTTARQLVNKELETRLTA